MSSNAAYEDETAKSGVEEQDTTRATQDDLTKFRTAETSQGREDESTAASNPPVSPGSDSSARPTSSLSKPRTPRGPVRTDTTTALAQALSPARTPPSGSPPPAQITRVQSTAIGPSVEQAETALKDEVQSGPRLQITLLLTNGARHPFVLDPKYLVKRNVDVPNNDPFNLSVYKLKELILREWRDEWEQKPTSPSYIRLISFGKLLDDKASLKDQKFNREDRNVVHMTIKPQDLVDDDDGKGAKGSYASGRAGEEGRSPGCRCVIM